MRIWTLFLFLSSFAHAKCDVYYFSLDFGGAIGDGNEMVDFLAAEDVPLTLFLVGKNSSTANGKKVCEKIRNSKHPKIAIGNHTISHEGFNSKHSEAHIQQEIIGNEAFMNQCDAKRVVKYFRYPKGAPHPLAEKVLREGGYLGTYEEFFPQADASKSKAVWWTTDTRDWVKSTGASAWAQVDYFNKNGTLLSVDQDSWRDLVGTLKNAKASEAFNQKIQTYLKENGESYPTFETMKNVPGLHGPDAEEIARKVIRDEGKLGQDGKRHCFPLMHYGGINSFAAMKKIIPELKKNQAEFRGLGDGDTVNYQLTAAVRSLDAVIKCETPQTESFDYKVQAGDNLFSIARGMINTNRIICQTPNKSPVSKLVARILVLNNLKDTNEINPGVILSIPINCL